MASSQRPESKNVGEVKSVDAVEVEDSVIPLPTPPLAPPQKAIQERHDARDAIIASSLPGQISADVNNYRDYLAKKKNVGALSVVAGPTRPPGALSKLFGPSDSTKIKNKFYVEANKILTRIATCCEFINASKESGVKVENYKAILADASAFIKLLEKRDASLAECKSSEKQGKNLAAIVAVMAPLAAEHKKLMAAENKLGASGGPG